MARAFSRTVDARGQLGNVIPNTVNVKGKRYAFVGAWAEKISAKKSADRLENQGRTVAIGKFKIKTPVGSETRHAVYTLLGKQRR